MAKKAIKGSDPVITDHIKEEITMTQEDLNLAYKKGKTVEDVLRLHQKRFDAAVEPYKDLRPYKKFVTQLTVINNDLVRYVRNNLKDK